MIKTGANNVTKSKKEVANGYKASRFKLNHFKIILSFHRESVQKINFRKIVLLIFGSLMGLIVVELILRVSAKKTYDLSNCVSLDKYLHHVMIPNSDCRFKTNEWDVYYKINNFGLRDREFGQRKPVGTYRILMLGDSFVQGHGVSLENSLPKILEQKLNNNGKGQKIELINAGVFGYSPLVEYFYLKEKGLNFEPDMAILAFSLTDFWEDRQRFRELKLSYPDLSNEELKEKISTANIEFNFAKINSTEKLSSNQKISSAKISYHVKLWLRKNLKIYGAFVDLIKKRNQPVQKDVLHQGDIDQDIVAIMRGDKIAQNDWQKLWELPTDHIKLMSKILKEKQIPFVVVAIPEAVQVSDNEWPGRKDLGLARNFYDPRGPYQNELSQRLKIVDVPFINLLTDFQTSKTFPLYFNNDGHFREAGHRLAAQVIYQKLTEYFRFLH